MTLNIINFVDMVRREGLSFMECEESFITMKLIWHGYLVLSLGICVYKSPTETGLRDQKNSMTCIGGKSDLIELTS